MLRSVKALVCAKVLEGRYSKEGEGRKEKQAYQKGKKFFVSRISLVSLYFPSRIIFMPQNFRNLRKRKKNLKNRSDNWIIYPPVTIHSSSLTTEPGSFCVFFSPRKNVYVSSRVHAYFMRRRAKWTRQTFLVWLWNKRIRKELE